MVTRAVRLRDQEPVRSATVAFDLYLTDYPGGAPRSYPPLMRPADLAGMDVVFCTHEHIDHLDPWTLAPVAQASPEALFVMPESLVPLVKDVLPAERVVGSRADRPFMLNGVDIHPIPAAHDTLRGAEQGYRHQGYVARLGGVTVCHTGDTVMYDGLVERLRFAYSLMNWFRRFCLPEPWQRFTLPTIRQRLLVILASCLLRSASDLAITLPSAPVLRGQELHLSSSA